MTDPMTPLVLAEVREYLDAFMPVTLCRMDVSVGMLNIIVGSESGDETFILTAHRMFSPHGSDIPFISICGDPHPDRRNSRDCARMLVLADSRFIRTVLEFGRLVAARHWGCDDGGAAGIIRALLPGFDPEKSMKDMETM